MHEYRSMVKIECNNAREIAVVKQNGIRKSPHDGKVIDLPFLGRLLQVELPTPLKPQLLETTPFDMNKLKPDIQASLSK